MRKKLVRQMTLVGTALAALVPTTQSQAAELSRGYVVSFMIPAMYNLNEKDECPNGKNIDGPGLLERIVREKGASEDEVKAAIDPDTFDMYKMGQLSTFRGRKDGKPIDVFLHPLSNPEPMEFLQSKHGIGFDLDGKATDQTFTDPITGESGVDNQMSRILGCTDLNRGTPESRGKAAYGGGGRGGLAWLISVDGADNLQNDDSVTIRISRAVQNVVRGSKGIQKNVTYTIDTSDPRQQNNVYRGKIKDGVFVSDKPVDFFMSGGGSYEDLKRSRIRMEFKPDGTLEAFLGGYENIKMAYASESIQRGIGEQHGESSPGFYQAMVKLADTDIDKDPKTGIRTRISSTYQIGAVPAFVRVDKEKPTS